MKDNITRRDFLNGTQVAIGASLLTPWSELMGASPSHFALPDDYYPPAMTGLRGSHEGSWEMMHARVQGRTWLHTKPEEEYDLVVVGAGISGLSAARFYLESRPDAKVLIIDNHDDFGGHAKRNEFDIGGATRIGYGGTEAIDTPSSYTEVSKDLLVDIGIDTNKFYEAYDQELYSSLGLSKSIMFDDNSFSQKKLVTGFGKLPWEEFIAKTPMSDKAKQDYLRLWTDERDYLPGMSREEKYELLRRTSYHDYLKDYVKVDQQVLEIYRRWGMSFWCVGSDEIAATSVQSYDGGMPGLKHTLPRTGYRGDEPYIFHFPDGNASVARLLVRKLIPQAVPGSTMEDVVTSRIDYGELDRDGAPVRIRLNSTVVQVDHTADSSAVDVTFAHGSDAHTVRAKKCILACYNTAIPYICPELPEEQKAGLSYGVKVPLTYTKVLLKNWKSFADIGTDFVYYTDGFYKQAELDYPVSIGDYNFGSSPDQPMVVHMCYVPYMRDIQGPTQWRAGRAQVLQTSFETFEGHVRAQLGDALSGGGFDADRDIHAITVNRWPHGYAYSQGAMWEPEYASEEEKPWVIGRQQFGRISIANSDAAAAANTNAAISEAHRAVQEALAS